MAINFRFLLGLANGAPVFSDLPAMQQHVIQQHAGHHCFADRYCTDPNARVVAALGDDFCIFARFGDGLARGKNA